MDTPVLIMVTTGGRDDAERLGEALVVDHLAASCTVIPTVHSTYYLDGQLMREHEALLMVKTTAARAEAVKAFVRSRHDHAVPEMLQVAVEAGSPAYLSWLTDQVVARPER